MTGRVLLGPFLTRADAAERAGLAPAAIRLRPDLIHIGGRLLPEVYCRFQFGSTGIRRDIGTVVLAMRGICDDLTIADWLVRPNPALHGDTPLAQLNRTHTPARVLDALATHPLAPAVTTAMPDVPAGTGFVPHDVPALRRRRRRWPKGRHAPATSH